MQYKSRVRIPKPPRERDGNKICSRCSREFPLAEFAIWDRENRTYATCTACRARKQGKAKVTRERKKACMMPVDEMFGQSMEYMLMLRKPMMEIGNGN